MKGWLLDTNVLSALIAVRGAPSVKSWAASQPEESLYLSVLSLAEFDKGIAHLDPHDPARHRYIAARDALEARFGNRVLSVDDDIVRLWGTISGEIKRTTRQAPPVIDCLLAATAIRYRLYLVTRNVRDVKLCGAAVFDPWNDDAAAFPIRPKTAP
ncbi:plasmid stabilization protein [Rhizobium rhizosphaerae]|uniref:Ribonuclease VapC n=1 Tax=Xaviernesmea rhizosphaerae TaxID=1672749 RepID=A0A1Q9AH57_9HYPH|nr:type II toxin-antitoxin system VapC family toxin [Xaviernesmea rhizosphaerae]OLP54548.1 plasmid stabilization protein [Xaviernesmea rhizosphaerae]OQP85971.1 VapC toxin family PIN domain ribonuclease [Xaviernesmea rhizosphaerae]